MPDLCTLPSYRNILIFMEQQLNLNTDTGSRRLAMPMRPVPNVETSAQPARPKVTGVDKKHPLALIFHPRVYSPVPSNRL